MLLARHATKVLMVVRGPTLSSTMSQYLVDRIEASDSIEVATHSQVTSAAGSRRLETVTITDGRSSQERQVQTSHMFIFIGSVPRSDFPGRYRRAGRVGVHPPPGRT